MLHVSLCKTPGFQYLPLNVLQYPYSQLLVLVFIASDSPCFQFQVLQMYSSILSMFTAFDLHSNSSIFFMFTAPYSPYNQLFFLHVFSSMFFVFTAPFSSCLQLHGINVYSSKFKISIIAGYFFFKEQKINNKKTPKVVSCEELMRNTLFFFLGQT